MAKVINGSLNTTAYSGRYLTLSWWGAQSISGNYTDIHWTLLGAGGDSGKWYEAGNFKVVIAGETVYSSSARIQLWSDTTVASGTKRVTHNSNGSKSFSASVAAGIYYVAVNCSGSGSWDLKDIPRGATITSAPDFTDEQSPVIKYSNPAGASVDSLAICITLTGSNDDVAYRSINKTGSSYTFELTDAERKVLRAATVGATTRRVGFYLKTTIGSNEFYSKVWKTLTIVNCTPTLTPTVKDTGNISTQLTGDPTGTIISGYNNITLSTGAAVKKKATIASQSITIGGRTISAASGSVANISLSSGSIEYRVTDSRKLTATAKKTVTVIPYFKPTITLEKNNVSTSGEFLLKVSGSYFNGSFGAKSNDISVEFRWKDSGEEWSDWQPLSPTKRGNNFTASATVTGLDYRESYSVQARVTDTLGSYDDAYIAYTEEYTAAAVPVFDWGKNTFRHNTSVYFPNNKAIYGATADGMSIHAICFCNDNNNLIIGYGGMSAGIGYTNIYGNSINIKANNSIKFNDVTMGDFVTAQGVTDGWYWRKWYSGKAECWKTLTINTAFTTSWGSMYIGTTKMSRQTYPFTFNTKPKEVVNVASNNYAAWVYSDSDGRGNNTTTATAIYNLCRPSQVTTATNFDLSIYVLGTLA